MLTVQVYRNKAYRAVGKPKRSLSSAMDVALAAVRDEPALVRIVDESGAEKYKRDFRKKPVVQAPAKPVAFLVGKNGHLNPEQRKNLEAQTTSGQL